MRTALKICLCLVAINLGLLFVFCNSVWTQETKKGNARIKELQQKRLATLEEVRDTAKKLFANGLTTYEEVHTAEREFLAARLESAETREEQIKVCDQAIKEALELQQRAAQMVQIARATRLVELKAQVYLLETQIARESVGAVD